MNDSLTLAQNFSPQITGLDSIFSNMKDQMDQILMLLSERERFVIEKRFALNAPDRSTLEEIGQHFDVTRERVRQIEKNAMQKLTRNINNFDIFEVNHVAFDILQAHGGLLSEDRMISKLLMKDTGYQSHALLFVLSLDKRFNRFTNTIAFKPYFRLTGFSNADIQQATDAGMKLLKKVGDVMSVAEVQKSLCEKNAALEKFSVTGLSSLFEIHKGFKVLEDGGVGLVSWKHIHPRTLRDKIYYVLRRDKDPMHFVAIANAITDANFDQKSVNLQAVHNELIRYGDFILIGRGIYALKEWGFSSGTVSDIIEAILKGKEQMSEDEIIDAVLEQRQVKPITIILNLKNKPQFVRVGRKRYTLKK
ncbi:hypothetical protein KC725_02605 [Candidatus Peregrinibacteria bacterium]|nr:hypothetical protein [Candidatus Peregrinibacteria bacterium]